MKQQQIADELHEMKNWIAVFEQEYELPPEVVRQLRMNIDHIAALLAET
jgi:hypothetical protein